MAKSLLTEYMISPKTVATKLEAQDVLYNGVSLEFPFTGIMVPESVSALILSLCTNQGQ